jgi:hypothetical protein
MEPVEDSGFPAELSPTFVAEAGEDAQVPAMVASRMQQASNGAFRLVEETQAPAVMTGNICGFPRPFFEHSGVFA